mgnify:CR=1 FL=1
MRILPVLAPATLTDAGTASTGETILFGVVALITVVCGLGLLTAKRAVSAAANMIGIMIGLAVLYVAGEAPFLGMTQIVVYTGAVMTLVLFVIMMVGIGGDEGGGGGGGSRSRPPARRPADGSSPSWGSVWSRCWPPSCGAQPSRAPPASREGTPPFRPLSPESCSATTSSPWN